MASQFGESLPAMPTQTMVAGGDGADDVDAAASLAAAEDAMINYRPRHCALLS